MGKHEAPESVREVPEAHETHRIIRDCLKGCWRTTRDVLVGGGSIILFEWLRVAGPAMPVSHHSEAIAWMVSNVPF